MDPISIITGIVAVISAVVGVGASIKQMKDESNTTDYNKGLNQTIFDREDSSWQRAVEDRAKSGLSIAGLNQGAGAGGTVSQLQAPQANGALANLMQNMSGQAFGLSANAYEAKKNRELQQKNFNAELRLKKEELHNSLINARIERIQTLATLTRENQIFKHNMDIAKGNNKNPLASVYGSSPSEIKELVTALVNNKDSLIGSAKNAVEDVKTTVTTGVDNVLDNIKDFFNPPTYKQIPDKILNQLTNSTRTFVDSSAIDIENVQRDTRDGSYKMRLRNRSNGKIIYYDIPESDVKVIKNYFQKNPFTN